MKPFTVMSIFGTRPEAIKLAPVIQELERRHVAQAVCVTAQHREMLDQMLELFRITPDYDLNIMSSGQSLEDIASKVIFGMHDILEKNRPSLVLVQGDTSTVLFGALAAFYLKIPVAHIEAGLRTGDRYDPFPEEINRRLVSQIASLHFAPTERAKGNLLKSGIDPDTIFVTGNTVIDALQWVIAQQEPLEAAVLQGIGRDKRLILITTHRRENLGDSMTNIFKAVLQLVQEFEDIEIIFPVHKNPLIQTHAKKHLGDMPRIHLIDPLSYSDLAAVMARSYIVLTDSGGIQEEAPALGKPVLVMRKTTERPEGIAAGTAKLVGTDQEALYSAARTLLTDKEAYAKMANAVNPYGNGTAGKQIVDIILNYAKPF